MLRFHSQCIPTDSLWCELSIEDSLDGEAIMILLMCVIWSGILGGFYKDSGGVVIKQTNRGLSSDNEYWTTMGYLSNLMRGSL